MEAGEQRRSSAVTISLLVFVFLSFAGMHWVDRQRIATVRTFGVSGLSSQPVAVVLDSLRNTPRKAIDLSQVRQRLESIPFVQQAHVYFGGVRTVAVDIEERHPVAHVVLPTGLIQYVDKEGTLLPPSAVRTAHDVPLIRRTDGAALTEQQRKEMCALVCSARSVLHTELYAAVSEVILRSGNTAIIITPEGSWTVQATERCGLAGGVPPSHAFAMLNKYSRNVGIASVLETDLDLRWHRHIVVKGRA